MIRSGASSNLVLSSLVFEYGCDAMILLDSELTVRAQPGCAGAPGLASRPGGWVAGLSYGAGLSPGPRAPGQRRQACSLPRLTGG